MNFLAYMDRNLLLALMGELAENQQAFTDMTSALLERIQGDESDLAEDITDIIIACSLRVRADVANKVNREMQKQKARLN